MKARTLPVFSLLLALAIPASARAAAPVTDADVVIYGGTSGGVAAALQAARMGRTAVLVEPTRFTQQQRALRREE